MRMVQSAISCKKYNNNNNNYSYYSQGTFSSSSYSVPQQFQYIEARLLKTPIEDNRKLVVGLVLSRYLINIKKLEYEEAYKIIWEWLDRCAKLKPLQPSNSYFDRYVVRYQLDTAQENGIPPMSEYKMKSDYPELYESLKP